FSMKFFELSMLYVIMASVGFAGSLVFYNAYLPEIAEEKDQDRVSAKGFALGYIGSSILLMLCLVILMQYQLFGFEEKETATRFSFFLTGVWWIGFSQVSFAALPVNVFEKSPEGNKFLKGFRELKMVWLQMIKTVRLKRYLFAFFIYNMGVQTVMLMAVSFGKKEVPALNNTGMIISVLIIQFIAILGANLFSNLSSRIGNLKSLMTIILIWCGICIWALWVDLPYEFYITAALVGLVMGGVQSLSRSTYSKFLPKTKDHASFFSFFDVTEKVGIMIGMFIFGSLEGLTGSMRASVFALIAFFIVGLVLLIMVPENEKNDV
ncbi:MAG: MFS transporter, partial [Flavobacteriales bacterium]